MSDNHCVMCTAMLDRTNKAEARVDELKAALNVIARGGFTGASFIAREALAALKARESCDV